jgi:hypothetical protein
MPVSVMPAGGGAVPRGYLHIAAAVEPTLGRTPLPRNSPRKAELLRNLSVLAGQVSAETGAQAAVFSARLITPGNRAGGRRHAAPARYDVAVLLEINDLDGLEQLQDHSQVRALVGAVTDAAAEVLVMPARCVRTIADVDRSRPGLFLFNYFNGPDPERTLDAWQRVVAWYERETGLDNSTLLGPVTAGPFTLVNHARWDVGLPRLAARQFLRPSFRRDILGVLAEARVRSQPIFFKLVSTTAPAGARLPAKGAR